jgi:PST family polysaccharide transporter
LTSVLLGPKWHEAAQLIGALAIIGAIEALNSCYWPMMLARVGPKTVFMLSALGVILTVPAFGAALWGFGLMPALAAWIVCSTLMLFLGAKLLVSDLGGSLKPLLRGLLRPVAGALLMSATVLAAQRLLPPAGSWLGEFGLLLGLVACGALAYSLTVWALWLIAGRPETAERELVSLVKARLRGRLRKSAANRP